MPYRQNAIIKETPIKTPINYVKYYSPFIRFIRFIRFIKVFFALPIFILWIIYSIFEFPILNIIGYILFEKSRYFNGKGFFYENEDVTFPFWNWYWKPLMEK